MGEPGPGEYLTRASTLERGPTVDVWRRPTASGGTTSDGKAEVLDGLARMLDVLHAISDGLRALSSALARADKTKPPPPAMPRQDTKLLFSIGDLAHLLGVPVGTIRNLRHRGKAPTVTKVGGRLMFQRTDVDTWLAEQREEETEDTSRWRAAHLPGRIGSSIPRSTQPYPYCSGSHTEPMAASRYSGRGVCRVCRDDVVVNRDGRLRKHRPV